ncbi:hypothetical protein CCP3SC15_890015 [Gammaproteobacteria bacterium]
MPAPPPHHLADPAAVPPSAVEFLAYCEVEYERRTSSGNPFDESLFRSAVDLVLRKLRHLEKRGCT